MKNKQTPISSDFNAASTAAEVLAGCDLSQITAMVTGGYSGIGLETTRALTQAGAHVVIPARRPDVALSALEGISNTEVAELNLADLKSVHCFAEQFLASGRHVDIFIGSAGIMACPETRVGPGWEAQFAINHLGHYALVNLLWPVLKGGARVVLTSSAAHYRSAIRWDDIQFTQGYDKILAYGQSKTANALFSVQLDTLGKDDGVRAFSVSPGKIFTPLLRHFSKEEMAAVGWTDENGNLIDSTFKTPQQGAATQVWAATSPQLKGRGGQYCRDCNIVALDESESSAGMGTGVRSYAVDPEQATRLWKLSAELTHIDAFAV